MQRKIIIIFIIIIVLGLVVFGWFKGAEAPATNTATSTPQTATTTTQNTVQNGVLSFKELNVQITIPSDISDIRYETKTVQGIGTVAQIVTLTNPSCELGVFYRIEKNDVKNGKTKWTEETLEAATSEQYDTPPQVKEFSNFYFVFEPSQATCRQDQTAIQEETIKRSKLWLAIPSAKEI